VEEASRTPRKFAAEIFHGIPVTRKLSASIV